MRHIYLVRSNAEGKPVAAAGTLYQVQLYMQSCSTIDLRCGSTEILR